MDKTQSSERLARTGLRILGLRTAIAGPFNLSISPGAVVCISGTSGSGKSLFLRSIADLDPNEGLVELDGQARSALSAHAWRRLAPYVAAESGWWREDAIDHFSADHREAAFALGAQLGLHQTLLKGPVSHLSTGERQRVALIRALALSSPVLLLDEPTGPLDVASVRKVEDALLHRARSGTIVVMASHDPEQGRRLGAERREMTNRLLGPPL